MMTLLCSKTSFEIGGHRVTRNTETASYSWARKKINAAIKAKNKAKAKNATQQGNQTLPLPVGGHLPEEPGALSEPDQSLTSPNDT